VFLRVFFIFLFEVLSSYIIF